LAQTAISPSELRFFNTLAEVQAEQQSACVILSHHRQSAGRRLSMRVESFVPQSSNKTAPHLALPWVIRLRYAMAIGQIATVAVVDQFFGIHLPWPWILLAPGLVILSNVWLSRLSSSLSRTHRWADSTLIGSVFVLDTLCLTAVLMLTGGPHNPFTLLYLVHITLSATILTQRQTWALGILACLCFGSLFWCYRPIHALEMHHGEGPNLHLSGMWVSFTVGSLLVAIFSGKISAQLREREASLRHMQEELAKKERLASLVTLAAGAAHELNTPLGTIAVVAKELERYATLTAYDAAVAEDSRLIRTEVDRCREILRRLSAEGNEVAAWESVPAGELADAVQSQAPQLVVQGTPEVLATQLTVPRRAVEQALISLVNNATDASPTGAHVQLSLTKSRDALRFEVRDRGVGMSEEELRHAGEPFFTTKEPGRGMGLGIFLVRTLADRIGARFTLESAPGAGTSAALDLPLAGAPGAQS